MTASEMAMNSLNVLLPERSHPHPVAALPGWTSSGTNMPTWRSCWQTMQGAAS